MRAAKKSTKIKLDEDPFAFLEEEEAKKKKKEDNLEDFKFFDKPNEANIGQKKN